MRGREGGGTHEGAFLPSPNPESESGLEGGHLFVDFVSVEGKARLKAENIPGPQPHRGCASHQESAPKSLCLARGREDFEPVFPGVPGSGHE